jgi:hypothetical protein
MMRAQDESIAFVAEHDVLGLWPHPQSVHSGPHRAPRTTRNKRGRKPPDNIGLEWWPFSSLLEIAERRDAQAARRRMRSPMRSTARLIAAYACCPHARVRREPEGTSATVTAQATGSHVPLRLSRRRTTRAPRTCCVCWARAANTLYSAYVRACALLDSSSPITSIRMGSIGSSAPGPLQYSCDALHHEGHRALFSGGKGQATYGAALPGARIGSCLRGISERRSIAFRTETFGFRMKSGSKPQGGQIGRYAPSPYCFILRHSVTVLIFSASAAWRRFPRKRSSARSIMARSCA